jgi:hypothetical protein
MIKRFAEIDENNQVLRILNCESLEFLENTFGGKWVETFEDNLAGIGDVYDETENKFLIADADYNVLSFVDYESSQNL